jgi:hypothetical protein
MARNIRREDPAYLAAMREAKELFDAEMAKSAMKSRGRSAGTAAAAKAAAAAAAAAAVTEPTALEADEALEEIIDAVNETISMAPAEDDAPRTQDAGARAPVRRRTRRPATAKATR